MKEQIISFSTAKLAKEKELSEGVETIYFYTHQKCKMYGIDEHNRHYPIVNTPGKLYNILEDATLHPHNIILAPTQSLLQKWLREEFNISVRVDHNLKDRHTLEFSVQIYDVNNYSMDDITVFPTYEEALEEGLSQALELIKIKP